MILESRVCAVYCSLIIYHRYYLELLIREGILLDKNINLEALEYSTLLKSNIRPNVALPSGTNRPILVRSK